MCSNRFGADVNALKRSDWTPLMLACTKTAKHDKLETVRVLLENDAIVNFRNKDGWTAAHIACREGFLPILQLLRCHNANLAEKTRNGRSALHIASLHKRREIVQDLLGAGEY